MPLLPGLSSVAWVVQVRSTRDVLEQGGLTAKVVETVRIYIRPRPHRSDVRRLYYRSMRFLNVEQTSCSREYSLTAEAGIRKFGLVPVASIP